MGVELSTGGKSFKVGVEVFEHLFSKYCQSLSQKYLLYYKNNLIAYFGVTHLLILVVLALLIC